MIRQNALVRFNKKWKQAQIEQDFSATFEVGDYCAELFEKTFIYLGDIPN